MAAAEFSVTQTKFSHYVGSKVKRAAGVRAITNLEHPDLKEHVEPTRAMKTETMVVGGNNVVTKTALPVLND